MAKPTISLTDHEILTFDTSADLSFLNIASNNKTNDNDMKVGIDNGTLKLPTFVANSDKTESARFYVTYTGLNIGSTYTIKFDMKIF